MSHDWNGGTYATQLQVISLSLCHPLSRVWNRLSGQCARAVPCHVVPPPRSIRGTCYAPGHMGWRKPACSLAWHTAMPFLCATLHNRQPALIRIFHDQDKASPNRQIMYPTPSPMAQACFIFRLSQGMLHCTP